LLLRLGLAARGGLSGETVVVPLGVFRIPSFFGRDILFEEDLLFLNRDAAETFVFLSGAAEDMPSIVLRQLISRQQII